ncbi:group II truncated hemoglobin [Kribbella alba]|uniref:group II truncated hemoglobin n=1 Tax=Kribbella alba TaxID=190197 RepID=UPI0031D30AAD
MKQSTLPFCWTHSPVALQPWGMEIASEQSSGSGQGPEPAQKSLYEHAGGWSALRGFVDIFYTDVLADPLLQPLFGSGRPEHVDHLTAFDAESFGGPDDFSRSVGFAQLIDAHRGLAIAEPQRVRFVELYLAAADKAGLPADHAFRTALREHVEFGSRVAVQNSHAQTEADLHPLREVPHWHWPDS